MSLFAPEQDLVDFSKTAPVDLDKLWYRSLSTLILSIFLQICVRIIIEVSLRSWVFGSRPQLVRILILGNSPKRSADRSSVPAVSFITIIKSARRSSMSAFRKSIEILCTTVPTGSLYCSQILIPLCSLIPCRSIKMPPRSVNRRKWFQKFVEPFRR